MHKYLFSPCSLMEKTPRNSSSLHILLSNNWKETMKSYIFRINHWLNSSPLYTILGRSSIQNPYHIYHEGDKATQESILVANIYNPRLYHLLSLLLFPRHTFLQNHAYISFYMHHCPKNLQKKHRANSQ